MNYATSPFEPPYKIDTPTPAPALRDAKRCATSEDTLVKLKDELQTLQRQQVEHEIAQLELAAKIMRKTIEMEDAEIAFEMTRAGA